MNLLLDTHIFIWYATEPDKIGSKTYKLLSNPKNNLYVSSVSIWETAYLFETKPKSLKINKPLAVFWEEALSELRIQTLNITPQHSQRFYEIQAIKGHSDIFDRMLIAQAASTGITLVSADQKFPFYKMISLIQND
jgi:PIN domain nuclease of toxin-antitoxin system